MSAMATGGSLSCEQIIGHYLTTGIYDALKTYDAAKEQAAKQGVASQKKRVDQLQGDTAALLLKTSAGSSEWQLHGGVSGKLVGASESGTPTGPDGKAQYSYSFLYKAGAKIPAKTSVLNVGGATNAQPGIWQRGDRLEAQVSLVGNPGFKCLAPTPLVKHKWTAVSVAVGPKHVRIFLNGKLAKQCGYKGREVKLLRKKALLAPGSKGSLSFGGFGPGSDAMVKGLTYYPSARLTQELILSQMTLNGFQHQERQATRERKEEARAAEARDQELDAFDRQLMEEENEMSETMDKARLGEPIREADT